MLDKNTLTIDNSLREEINTQLQDGGFSSAEEVVKAGISLLKQHQREKEVLRKAIQEGRDSGYIEDFDWDEFLLEKHKEYTTKNADI